MALSMNMDARLSQNLSMQLTFAQKLSLEILQLGVQELETRIAEELENNPMLELKQPEQSLDTASPNEAEPVISEHTPEDVHVDNDNREQMNDLYNPYLSESEYRGGGGQDDDEGDFLSTLSQGGHNFMDDMHTQIEYLEPAEELKPLIDILLSQLDDRGYLPIELDELIKQTEEEIDIPEEPLYKWQKALRFIQEELKPAGMGAKDLKECLLIQIYRHGKEFQYELELVDKHFKTLLKNHLQVVAEKEEVPVEKIVEVMEFVKTLNPQPTAIYRSDENQVLRPDAIVKYDSPDLFNPKGKFRISLANQDKLELEVIPGTQYRHEGLSKAERQYLNNNTNNAKALVEAVRRRNQTLFLVIQSICQRQLKFFEEGRSALVPLQMQEIAKELEISAATITRTVKDKVIQTDYGTFPLKHFFSLKKVKMGDGEVNERDELLKALKTVIDEENKKKPLSDAAISKTLSTKGFKVAVRTVSKYRDILDIPSSSKRKQF